MGGGSRAGPTRAKGPPGWGRALEVPPTSSCLFPFLFHQAVKVPHPPARSPYEGARPSALFGAIYPCEYLPPNSLAQLGFLQGLWAPSPSLGLSYPTSSISHLPCSDLGQRRSLEWPPPGTQHPGQGLQPSWAPPLPFSQVSWPRSHPWGPSQVSVPWGPAGCRAGMREPVHSLRPLC